jgi:DNA polymerase III alpha subunit
MIPLFKSHYSIGKSILTLDHPEKSRDDGSDSIFSIAQEESLDTIYLVEDSMIGFFDAFKKAKEFGIKLIFGYRFTCCTDVDSADSHHKLIAFALNDQGCKDLNKFYSHINAESNGVITNSDLLRLWTENMLLAVPFYDSFIFKNHLSLSNCTPDFKHIKPIFFVERNNLPFDSLIEDAVRQYASQSDCQVQLAKSIYYRYKSDYEALQTYKVICNRSFGRQATLSSPNLNHFGSDEFCWESFKEQ